MNPAPSVIIFSVLSGAGFGLLAFLGLGIVTPLGWPAFWWWGLGYALAVAGLLAATFHLGNRKNAIKSFSQWRTSWLSREAWASVATLVILSPVALSDWLELGWPRIFGVAGAGLALFTVFTTAMIYAQIKAVPRWHHWLTPVMFVVFAVAGGAVLSGQGGIAAGPLAAVTLSLLAVWRVGDGQFARAAVTLGTATGLGRIGKPSVFEQPHTGSNYLMHEMIHVVGRRHAKRLRILALVLAGVFPALILLIFPASIPAHVAAAALHIPGAFAARWLFFAQAEHVVGLYYGAHQA